jgi:hypothetical protein
MLMVKSNKKSSFIVRTPFFRVSSTLAGHPSDRVTVGLGVVQTHFVATHIHHREARLAVEKTDKVHHESW